MKGKRIVIDARCVTPHMHGIARVALRFIENAAAIAPDNEYIILHRSAVGEEAFPKADCLRFEECDTKLYGLRERFAIPRLLERLSPDMYYSPTCFAPTRACCPVVFAIYDLIYISAPGSGDIRHNLYFKWFVRKAAKNARRIITDSRYVAGELHVRLGIPPDKISTVYLGVDDAFAQGGEPPDVGEPYILNVSNPFPHKNTAGLLEAYGILLEKGTSDYKLVVAGSQNEKVNKIARSERLRHHVELTGDVDDERLVGLMRGASLFVLPSRYEGFGLPVLEAMKAGVPVIAGDNTAMTEIFDGAACLVDAKNPQAVAEAMLRLLNDENERKDLAARGAARARDFSWRKMTEEILAVFDMVRDTQQ